MKKLLLPLLVALPLSFFAQVRAVVEYEQTIKIEIPDKVKQRMADQGIQFKIPESRSVNHILTINNTQSNFKMKLPEKDDVEERAVEFKNRRRGGFRFRGMRWGADNLFYKNLETGKKVQKQDLMGKTFLIEDDLDAYKWKVTGNSLKILDYQCMEASAVDGERVIKAWFTPQIPVSNGPAAYGQLPGLILKVDINDGKQVFLAKSVELDAEFESFEQPAKGKKVTQAEFEEIRKKKMEELREIYGEGRGRMIIDH